MSVLTDNLDKKHIIIRKMIDRPKIVDSNIDVKMCLINRYKKLIG